MPYGVTLDGSDERNTYILNVQSYMASVLVPLFEAWEGELPTHLQKARAAPVTFACWPAGTSMSLGATPLPCMQPPSRAALHLETWLRTHARTACACSAAL